jgi:hypothetical protein
MKCSTVRSDIECPFMSSEGCSFNGGVCHNVVESCDGCNRKAEYSDSWYCSACPDPESKWKNGKCNLATHVKAATNGNKVKINPLKASKRGH